MYLSQPDIFHDRAVEWWTMEKSGSSFDSLIILFDSILISTHVKDGEASDYDAFNMSINLAFSTTEQ